MSHSHRRLAAVLAILLSTGGCNQSDGNGSGPPPTASDEPNQELRAAVTEEPMRRVYEARQWQTAWTDRSAQQLIQTLQGAARHGLNPADFTQGLEGGQGVQRDIALTRAALAYANALAHGRVDPKRLFQVYTVPGNEVDVPAGLAQAIGRGNVGEWIESLAPQDEEYRALSQAYVQLMQAPQPGQQQAQPQPQQPANAKGRQRSPAQTAPTAPRDRAVILAVNMERRRWLARQAPATRIDVNTAASFLRYVRDNQIADQRVVVNGQPGWETPELGTPLFRLVANPDWTVPPSIERNELANLSEAALQRKHMTRRNGRIVQQPGPDNALGLVKLDLKNDQAIYLHDTPSKWAFQRPERHLSHGCVRVNDAVGFARMIAEQAGKLAEFDRAMRDPDHDTGFIDLGQEIPVRLMYQTAFVDNGQLVFAPDRYGWDAKVAEALHLPVPPGSRLNEQSADRARQQREGDVGP